MVAFCYRPIGFRHAIDVHGNKIQVGHLLEQVGRRRRGRDSDADGRGKFLGIFRRTKECINCWCCIEVCYMFSFEELPDQRVVNFAEAVVRSSDSSYGPGKGWRSLAKRNG